MNPESFRFLINIGKNLRAKQMLLNMLIVILSFIHCLISLNGTVQSAKLLLI